jgi:anti-sigma regulatory factor (Ser/Thr protein kinase)
MVCRLATDEDAPRTARAVVDHMLKEIRGSADHRRDDMSLAVSEMVSNAVLHGPPGEVEMRISATPELVRIEVSDRGNEPFDKPPEAGEVGHWGLGLVAEFSDRFGIEHTPRTKVWCEFDIDATDSLTRHGYRDR